MKKFVFVLFYILLLSVCACNEQRKYKKTVSIVQELLGKSISFCNNNRYYVNMKDTVLIDKTNHQYTIVTYAHPSKCEACVWKLEEWYLKRKELLYYNDNIDFKFIIQSQNYDNISHYMAHAMPGIPLIYDSTGMFIKKNNLPEEQRFHSFLLNENKEIILVGSPIGNDKLWDMYKEIIKNKK